LCSERTIVASGRLRSESAFGGDEPIRMFHQLRRYDGRDVIGKTQVGPMPYTTLDVSEEVLTIKRLGAAAAIPNVLAFVLARVTLIALVLDIRHWVLWFSIFAVHAEFVVLLF